MRIIESITFDITIDGKKICNVPIAITASQGYTDTDISSADGRWFGTRIGRDFYDLHVYTNPLTKRLEMEGKLLRKTKKGKWIESNSHTALTITNIKVKYIHGLK